MKNYRSVLARLRWNAGELLPGHRFRIHDFAVQKNSGKVVLLTGVCRNGESYCYICLDDLETEEALCGDFQIPSKNAVIAAHEILKKKLIRIMKYQGREYYQKLLDKFIAGTGEK